MQQSILITGGAGYIGSHIAFLLMQEGYHVIILDSFVHEQPWPHTWATVIQADFGDKKTLTDIFQTYDISAVIHCAAVANINQALNNPTHCYRTNATSTLILLETMLNYKVKNIIVASSCAVYGNPHTIPIREDHPRNPINPYGKSKLMVEYLLEDFHEAYGLNFIALRFFNAAGGLPEHNLGEIHSPETHVIPLLLRAQYHSQPFYVFGNNYSTPDGTCIRDFLHVWDIAQAHLLALSYLEHKPAAEFINLGTGKGVSILELIHSAQQLNDKRIKKITCAPRTGDPAILVADSTKAHKLLHWKPQHSDLKTIITSAQAYEVWHRQQKSITNQTSR